MDKIKLGVIFGGMSTEHDVSIVSGTSVIKNLDKEKYNITPIYINLEGEWFLYKKEIENIEVLNVGEEPIELQKIKNPMEILKQQNVVFPVLHGLYGEDGTIQGMLEMLKIPYVGCRVLGSCVCMDKVYTKIILDKANIKQAKYVYVKKLDEDFVYIDNEFNFEKMNIEEIANIIIEKLKLPVFVKPSNSGSSVGIRKAKTIEELIDSIKYAAEFDTKIVIEENINAREIECAVMGNDDIKASCVGEILPAEDFYSFDAKYNNAESKVVIPANISNELSNKIREIAIKAFKAVDAKGISRVDFFVEKETQEIYLNEINTMPGFTKISMYPQLWENCGLSYKNLLDELINLAMKN